MKKLFLSFIAMMFSLAMFAGEQRADNGVGLRIFGGFGKEFALYNSSLAPIYEAKPEIGIGLDNRWYFGNMGIIGLALQARWFDFSFNRSEEEVVSFNGYSTQTSTAKYNIFAIDALNAGAIITFYLGRKVAIDAFYDLGPSALIYDLKHSEFDGVKVDGDKIDNIYAFGLGHKAGAALRLGIFQLGAEAKFGKIKIQDWGDDNLKVEDTMGASKVKTKLNSVRIFVGFKF